MKMIKNKDKKEFLRIISVVVIFWGLSHFITEPVKIRFLDKVIIHSNFYAGLCGTVTSISENGRYLVALEPPPIKSTFDGLYVPLEKLRIRESDDICINL